MTSAFGISEMKIIVFPHFVFGPTENLLGALLRIKEVIRRRVESSEEEDMDERGMTQRLEDILRESSGEREHEPTSMHTVTSCSASC